MTIGFYMLVSRFLETFGVEIEQPGGPAFDMGSRVNEDVTPTRRRRPRRADAAGVGRTAPGGAAWSGGGSSSSAPARTTTGSTIHRSATAGRSPSCAREGARVACADRDPASAEETVRRVIDEGGQGARSSPTSPIRPPWTHMVAGAHHELGGLDGVVYNVGIGAGFGLERRAGAVGHVMNVNLRGAMLTAAARCCSPTGRRWCSSRRWPGSSRAAGSRCTTRRRRRWAGCAAHRVEGERRAIRANIVAPGLMDTALGRVAAGGRRGRARRCRWDARARAGRRRTPCCSCCPTSRRTSPARRSWSTEASARCDDRPGAVPGRWQQGDGDRRPPRRHRVGTPAPSRRTAAGGRCRTCS